MRSDRSGAGVAPADRVPALLAPGLLTAAGVLRLQRTVGNAAVAKMLEGGRASQVAIQRRGKSAEHLKKLAVPKVGEGQSIEVRRSSSTRLSGSPRRRRT